VSVDGVDLGPAGARDQVAGADGKLTERLADDDDVGIADGRRPWRALALHQLPGPVGKVVLAGIHDGEPARHEGALDLRLDRRVHDDAPDVALGNDHGHGGGGAVAEGPLDFGHGVGRPRGLGKQGGSLFADEFGHVFRHLEDGLRHGFRGLDLADAALDAAGLDADDLGDEDEVLVHGERFADDHDLGTNEFADLDGLLLVGQAGQFEFLFLEDLVEFGPLDQLELLLHAQAHGQQVGDLLAEVSVLMRARVVVEDGHRREGRRLRRDGLVRRDGGLFLRGVPRWTTGRLLGLRARRGRGRSVERFGPGRGRCRYRQDEKCRHHNGESAPHCPSPLSVWFLIARIILSSGPKK